MFKWIWKTIACSIFRQHNSIEFVTPIPMVATDDEAAAPFAIMHQTAIACTRCGRVEIIKSNMEFIDEEEEISDEQNL